jgi:RNA polymerase sigma-70 factor (ECF subfamily)
MEQYRAYLNFLARRWLDPRLQPLVGISDVVQITLMKASSVEAELMAQLPAEQRWRLRNLLNGTLKNEIGKAKAQMRDVRRTRSLDEAFEKSSVRLQDLLGSEESTPSVKVMAEERDMQVAQALAELPEHYREALILKYWHGMTLTEIAEQMGVTEGAVTGWVRRGLEKLGTHFLQNGGVYP